MFRRQHVTFTVVLCALGPLASCQPAPRVNAVHVEPSPAAPTSWVLRVDLSELPAERLVEFASALGADSVDHERGEVVLGDDALESLLTGFVRTTLVEHRLERFDFYGAASYPRLAWWENVVVQLPEFVQYGVYERYSGYSRLRGAPERLRAFLAYRIVRTPEQLTALYGRYADAVFALMPRSTYEAAGYGRFVRGLLRSHQHMSRHSGRIEELDAAIRALDAQDMFSGGRTAASYAVYRDLGLIDPTVRAEFVRAGGGYAADDESTDVVWFSSFWLRRHREGNTDAVARILRDIDRHYGRPGRR